MRIPWSSLSNVLFVLIYFIFKTWWNLCEALGKVHYGKGLISKTNILKNTNGPVENCNLPYWLFSFHWFAFKQRRAQRMISWPGGKKPDTRSRLNHLTHITCLNTCNYCIPWKQTHSPNCLHAGSGKVATEFFSPN